jgi:hypothetical protein
MPCGSFLRVSEWMYSYWNPGGCEWLFAQDIGTTLSWVLTLITLCIYYTQTPVIADNECGMSPCETITTILVIGLIAGVPGAAGIWLYAVSIAIMLLVLLCWVRGCVH